MGGKDGAFPEGGAGAPSRRGGLRRTRVGRREEAGISMSGSTRLARMGGEAQPGRPLGTIQGLRMWQRHNGRSSFKRVPRFLGKGNWDFREPDSVPELRRWHPSTGMPVNASNRLSLNFREDTKICLASGADTEDVELAVDKLMTGR